MTLCGIEIKGSEAIIAVAAPDLTHVTMATKKIALEDDDEAANVKAFASQVAAFVRDNGITRIAIKKRSKKGEFAGGPTTFKIEGVLQLLDGVEVTLLSPQTINAQYKKHSFELPATLNKYQHEAFKTACSALVKK
ncbi:MULTISPECIES: DUF3010 family protein [Pseudomonas]|jgi:hypothetical protein|uniref:DUF3010 family protein n=1 Tax=Pseudomonas proteolytica TaxID=219574 RepID=A0AAW5A6Q9_9PSED|nr:MULTISPECIES: DUF3010 family protein [Pseudomonas]TDR42871.1 DUF3010 family protein [Pseudomonas brenneri]VVO32710.1 hypothetical protein PS834_05129 [Pseudomonas fluorescens]KAA8706525.1 DUF3010 family protein [Pseudomonas proteolytica]MCF5057552.1 DUF3010 family protein [Pseudomonas proteolytica]MCF5104747.1 DUF3010 family protein [Pseudomonas proteolytica]